MLLFVTFAALVTLIEGHAVDHGHDGREVSPEFSKEWIVKLEGNVDSADLIAVKFGFVNKGEVRCFQSLSLKDFVSEIDLSVS